MGEFAYIVGPDGVYPRPDTARDRWWRGCKSRLQVALRRINTLSRCITQPIKL